MNQMATPRSAERERFEAAAFPLMDRLYRAARHMTRDAADAEDLVQDTFLRAYTYFHRFREGTNFRAWIFTIMRSVFINQYKKKKSQGIRVDLEPLADRLESDQPSPDGGTLTVTEIRSAMARLPRPPSGIEPAPKRTNFGVRIVKLAQLP